MDDAPAVQVGHGPGERLDQLGGLPRRLRAPAHFRASVPPSTSSIARYGRPPCQPAS